MTKPSPINDPFRCTQLFSNGKRCRLSVRPDSAFCPKHSVVHETSDLAATLTGGLAEFTSVMPINQFLSRLLLLLAQDRISPRRGAVMAYTANLLLRTLPAIEKGNAPGDPKHHRTTIIWDLPGPERERLTNSEDVVVPYTSVGGSR